MKSWKASVLAAAIVAVAGNALSQEDQRRFRLMNCTRLML